MNTESLPGGSSSKRETLERIFAAAKREFAAKGLAGARIDDIAREAGITKQLIYHYFRSKDELFGTILDESSQAVFAALQHLDLEQLPPTQAVKTLLERMFELYRDDPEVASLSQEGIRYHSLRETPRNRFPDLSPLLAEKLDEVMRRGTSTGEFRSNVEHRHFFAIASLCIIACFTSPYLVSTLVGFDSTTAEGMDEWRRATVEFLLDSIKDDHPAGNRRDG